MWDSSKRRNAIDEENDPRNESLRIAHPGALVTAPRKWQMLGCEGEGVWGLRGRKGRDAGEGRRCSGCTQKVLRKSKHPPRREFSGRLPSA